MEHTPAPWHTEKLNRSHTGMKALSIRARHNGVVTTIAKALWPGNFHIDESEANARRIVACVNACAGISTAGLEKYTVKDLMLKARLDALGYDLTGDTLADRRELDIIDEYQG